MYLCMWVCECVSVYVFVWKMYQVFKSLTVKGSWSRSRSGSGWRWRWRRCRWATTIYIAATIIVRLYWRWRWWRGQSDWRDPSTWTLIRFWIEIIWMTIEATALLRWSRRRRYISSRYVITCWRPWSIPIMVTVTIR